MDSTVAAARDAGVEVILTIQGAPEWASNNERGVIDIAPLSEFAEFMGALAERYDSDGDRDAPGSPRVRYFEMYNEPDLQYKADGTGGWGNHGKEYADMLKAIYPAVKEANPDARVTFGGIVYDTWTDDFFPGDIIKSFLTDVLDNGGGEYFDVMNYHAYPGLITRFDPGGGVGLKQKTDVMRGILANYNLQDLPIIITETGMHANSIPNFPSSPEIQANHLVKLFVQGMVVDIDALIWFSLYDPLPDYPLFNGLVSDDAPPVPRLALTTMQTLVDLMQTTRYVRTLDIAETGSDKMEAYQFFDTTLNRTIYIAWMNPINTTETHALLLSGGRADVIDVQANTQTIEDNTDGNVDGKVTVTVGDSPIFVVIR